MPTGTVGGDTGPPCRAARTFQLNNLALPCYHTTNSISLEFYPEDGLIERYTVQKVREILRCSCEICKRDKGHFKRSVDLEACGVKIVKKDGIRTFALLVHIQHPCLMLGFVQNAHDGIQHPSTVSDKDLKETYWRTYQKAAQDESNALIKEFQSSKHQFIAPLLDPTYQVYASEAVLPFANEEEIGRGAYGTVYRLEVPEHHCRNFPESIKPDWNRTTIDKEMRKHKCVVFARKEFSRRDMATFWAEAENLRRVRDVLEGKHIVNMLKPYRRGDTYSILFPYAEMSLEQFLDEKADAHRGVQLERDEVWSQVLGISEALTDIAESLGKKDLSSTEFHSSDAETWVGCHFDLKPANILIFGDGVGVWKIADFGQAAFKPRQGTDTNMTNEGGSDAYSAPETDTGGRTGTRYDVWSLGCIMLEVTAFIAGGREGRYGRGSLMTARQTVPDGSNGRNSRLWQRGQSEGVYVVKPEVLNFIQGLFDMLPLQTASGNFLRRILSLIKQMLAPDAKQRRDANGVVHELHDMIKPEEPLRDVELGQSQPRAGERPLGQEFLSGLRFWHTQHSPVLEGSQSRAHGHVSSTSVNLYLYASDDSSIRLNVVREYGWSDSERVTRSETMFVPVYAFSTRVRERSSYPHFYLSASENPRGEQPSGYHPSLVLYGLEFTVSSSFGHLPDAIAAQSAFTGQFVLGNRSFNLKSCHADLLTGKLKKVGNMLSRVPEAVHRLGNNSQAGNASRDEPSNSTGDIVMQIWREIIPDLSDATPKRPKIRRIAVFNRDRTIFLLPLQVEYSIRKGTDGNLVVFEPTDPSSNDAFNGSILQSRRIAPIGEEHIAFAGIPLDPCELQKREGTHKQKYGKVEMRFESSEDATTFKRIYIEEKKAYREERHG